MKIIKILYVIDSLAVGGAEKSLIEMLPHLAAANILPIIACLRKSDAALERGVQHHGCDLRFLSAAGLTGQVRALREIIQTERPDIIHTTLFHSDLAGRLAAIGCSVRVISSIVSTDYDPVKFRLFSRTRRARHRVAKWLDSWTARYLTDHLHAITQAVKDSAIRNLRIPAEKITVVERGRDPYQLGQPSAARRGQARLRLGLRADQEVILNVGRQTYLKGQRYLLEAMELLTHTHPQLILLVAGDLSDASSELDRLRERLPLKHCVAFLGYREDIADLLAAADLFVFPSLREGLGGAVIEAMALGLPVIASDIPALREVVEAGRNALLVKPASAAELAEAIQELLTNSEKALTFGQRSREIYENRFTLTPSVSRLVALYRRVLSS